MNYCDKCGGPLRTLVDYYGESQTECRLCDLDFMARRASETRSGAWMRSRRTYMTHEEAANSTANTPATSRWLPDGARLPFFDPMTPEQERRSDEALLDAWMMYHGVGSGWIHEFWGIEDRAGQV